MSAESIISRCNSYQGSLPTPHYPMGLPVMFYYLDNGDDVKERPVAFLHSNCSITAVDIRPPAVMSDVVFCDVDHLKKYRVVHCPDDCYMNFPESSEVLIFGTIDPAIDEHLKNCFRGELGPIISPRVIGRNPCENIYFGFEGFFKSEFFPAFILKNLRYSDGTNGLPRGLYADVVATAASLRAGDTPERLFKSGDLLIEVKTKRFLGAAGGPRQGFGAPFELKFYWTPKDA